MGSPLPSGSSPKFRVAICGAGIGGLILANTVGKYDSSIPIDLYEAHDSIETAGVGITVWKQTHDVMVDLGLYDEFKDIFTYDPERSRGPKVRRADIRDGGYPWYYRAHRYGPSAMHRQQMIAILERHLPASCTVHPKKRLVKYDEFEQEDALIRLEFADGTMATADVLVGADGVRSAVRKSMFEATSKDDGNDGMDLGQYIYATFSGMCVYRSLISAEMLEKQNSKNPSLKDLVIYAGKGRYLVTYPLAKGTLINVVAMTCDRTLVGTQYEGRWVTDATRDEVIEYFDTFEPDARAVINLCEKPSKWALHVVKPLPFCIRKRVALLGDACHAMTPHFGAGAVQAIDDAFILGRLIAHPLISLTHIEDALRIYQEVRFPFARAVASFSSSTGWMYAFLEPGYYDGTRGGDGLDPQGISAEEREGMDQIKQEILRRWDIMDDSKSAPQAWMEAECKLRALVDAATC